MVLRSYYLIFMGWSRRRAGIMKWSGKFLVYAGVFHVVCRGIGNILYIESCGRILVIILAITSLGHRYRHYYHSARSSLLLSLSLRLAIAIAIIITSLFYDSNYSSNHSDPMATTIAIP